MTHIKHRRQHSMAVVQGKAISSYSLMRELTNCKEWLDFKKGQVLSGKNNIIKFSIGRQIKNAYQSCSCYVLWYRKIQFIQMFSLYSLLLRAVFSFHQVILKMYNPEFLCTPFQNSSNKHFPIFSFFIQKWSELEHIHIKLLLLFLLSHNRDSKLLNYMVKEYKRVLWSTSFSQPERPLYKHSPNFVHH